MRSKFVSIFSILTAFSIHGWAADAARPAAGESAPKVTLATSAEPAAPKFSDAQLAGVSGWLREMAPAAPAPAVAAGAQHFLEELQWQHPDQLDRLLAKDFPKSDFESTLLRDLAAQLSGAPQAALREELARRRVQVLLARENVSVAPGIQDPTKIIEKLKGISPVYYRRLVEGRIDDDDLESLLTEARRTDAAASQAPAKPRVLTAADIVAEFSRHNQTGSALDRLRAYTIDGKLKLPSGEEQHLVLFKLRPGRFRMHVLAGEATRLILASDGTQFWQQAPGGKPQTVPMESLGTKRYLREFVNPLFGGEEGCTFERRDDGTLDGHKVYRIAVRRADGSQYVACIDPVTFHEVGGEYDKGISVRYSDFREVAGLTMAFREETSDREGHKDVFELTRFTPNPGLVQEFFDEPVEGRDLSYLSFERLLARAHETPGISKKN